MSKSNLRAVDSTFDHPRDIARRRVREYQEPKEPIVNIHVPEEVRPPPLNVDEVIRKSQPDLTGKK